MKHTLTSGIMCYIYLKWAGKLEIPKCYLSQSFIPFSIALFHFFIPTIDQIQETSYSKMKKLIFRFLNALWFSSRTSSFQSPFKGSLWQEHSYAALQKWQIFLVSCRLSEWEEGQMASAWSSLHDRSLWIAGSLTTRAMQGNKAPYLSVQDKFFLD